MTRNLLAIAGFAALALGATSAINAQSRSAASSDQAPTRHVSFGDLNLATPAGQQTLNRRIGGAVTRVCGDAFVRDLHVRTLVGKCRREARRSAEIQVARAIETAGQRSIAGASGTPGQSSLAR